MFAHGFLPQHHLAGHKQHMAYASLRAIETRRARKYNIYCQVQQLWDYHF